MTLCFVISFPLLHVETVFEIHMSVMLASVLVNVSGIMHVCIQFEL